MSKRIPVPPELEHLIEKREQEGPRRQAKRRSKPAAPENAAEATEKPERRTKDRRRAPRRRKSDS